MKKILTLLIAFGTVAAVHAQTSRDEARRVILGQPKSGNYPSDSRDVILGGGNYPNSYPGNYPNGSREAQIEQINRDYNYRIQQVRNNRYISRAERERQIRQLEREREMRIRDLNRQYNGNNGNYGRNTDYERHDNGKHLGWQKGVGNPHRYGGNPGHGNGKFKRDHDGDED